MSTNYKNPQNKNSSAKLEDEYTYTPRSRSASGSKSNQKSDKANSDKKFNKLAVIIPSAVVGVLLIAIVVYTMLLPKNKILNNVYVNSVNVGGMTQQDAQIAIEDLIAEDTEIIAVSSGKFLTLTPDAFELNINISETLNNLMSVGKTKNPFVNAYYGVKLLFSSHIEPLVLDYNTEKLNKLLFDFGTTINGVSTEPTFEYGENTVTIVPGTAGQNPDTSVAQSQLIESLSAGIYNNIEITLDYAEPQKLNTDEIYTKISTQQKDAEYTKSEDGKITVTEHTVGVEVDKEVLHKAIEKVNAGENATFTAKISAPQKTKEQLEAALFSSTMSTYTTSFSSSSANRAHNVKRATESINGIILMPGDEFSYTDAIGNPSLKNGYKVAPVFQSGKSAEGVGGGVCQVSSTLYNAVLLSDLQVTERQNHSLTVGYVPKGQDATFAYGSIDFKFKNNTEYPIKINATAPNRSLTISIIGTAYTPQRTVKISNSIVSTISPGENVTEDPALPAGTRNVVSSGSNGYVVDTYKTIYENGVEVSSKRITRSKYRATASEVVVGTAPVTAPTIATPGDAVDNSISNTAPSENTDIIPEQSNDTVIDTQITPEVTTPVDSGNNEISSEPIQDQTSANVAGTENVQ